MSVRSSAMNAVDGLQYRSEHARDVGIDRSADDGRHRVGVHERRKCLFVRQPLKAGKCPGRWKMPQRVHEPDVDDASGGRRVRVN